MSIFSTLAFFLEIVIISGSVDLVTSGYYTMIQMRGATHASIVLPRIPIEFVIYLVFFEMFVLLNWIYGLETTGW